MSTVPDSVQSTAANLAHQGQNKIERVAIVGVSLNTSEVNIPQAYGLRLTTGCR